MTRKTKRSTRKKSKERVPKAIREQTWLKSFGKVYEHSCYIKWCDNKITVFDFHVGHRFESLSKPFDHLGATEGSRGSGQACKDPSLEFSCPNGTPRRGQTIKLGS